MGLYFSRGALRITELIVRTGVLNSRGLRTVLAMIYPIFFVFKTAGNCASLFAGIGILVPTFLGGNFLIGIKFATLTLVGGADGLP